MDVPRSYKTALGKLNAYRKEHSLRISSVRELVLKKVCQFKHPFTAEQLEEVCAEEHISKGTVYNALNLFLDAKILHAANRQRGRTMTEYELIASNPIRMQFECKKCGRVVEFRDQAIERLIKEHKYSNFTMQHLSMFVYGECKRCHRATTETGSETGSKRPRSSIE